MSRYLQRVLARTTGQPVGPLRAPQPFRWSSVAADPFAAADPTDAGPAGDPHGAVLAPAAASIQGRPTGDGPAPATLLVGKTGGSVIGDGGQALEAGRSRALRGFDRGNSEGESRGDRSARPSLEPSAVRLSPSTEIPSVAGRGPGANNQLGAAVVAGRTQALSMPPPREAHATNQGRIEPSSLLMPPTPRREAAGVADAARSLRDHAGARGEQEHTGAAVSVAVAAHAAPLRPPAPAAARTEIVIGRISVLVESARPAAPAPRIVRQVTATPHAADESGGLSLRFGLGQI